MINRRTTLLTLFAAGASLATPALPAARPRVVATTGMIADAVRVLAGDFVDLKALMGPGIDPHAYRQTRTDIVALTRADLVLWHGLYLEAQMTDFFADLSRKRRVIPVAESLPQNVLRAHDDYSDKFDPHVWMDPDLWAQVVETIAEALVNIMPQASDDIARNARTYQSDLKALGAYGQKVLAGVPKTARVLLSAHDAFGYFGAAHDFEVLGIQGISTESEAGLQRIRELVDLLVTRDIRAVFVESSVSDRNMRALIEGAAARGHDVSIGGELYSDAMGPAGSYEGTYIGMIDHNVTHIARALGAQDVPERGMSGKLAVAS